MVSERRSSASQKPGLHDVLREQAKIIQHDWLLLSPSQAGSTSATAGRYNVYYSGCFPTHRTSVDQKTVVPQANSDRDWHPCQVMIGFLLQAARAELSSVFRV